MRKMFLSSSFKDVSDLFITFAGDNLEGKTVTFIPTAAIHEKVNFYVDLGERHLRKWDFWSMSWKYQPQLH